MFNTTSNKTTINNPATGIIQRSNEKSYFLTFQRGSSLEDKIFSDNPKHKDKEVSVLQALLMDGQWLLCELVLKSDL